MPGSKQRHPRAPLKNAASRADDRLITLFGDNRLDEIGALFAEDTRLEDRRQGLHRESDDRATTVDNIRAIAALGVAVTKTTLALRGDRLCLSRMRFEELATGPAAFCVEALEITEVAADGLMVAKFVFDLDDLDDAIAELDARYLAGEAAPYARVWQRAMDALGEANRHEAGPILSGLTYVDHRRVSFGSDDFGRAVEELWALVPDARYRVTEVHALDAHGTVASLLIEGPDSNGNELQWSRIVALFPDEPRMEVYEEDDGDAALARFEELRPRERRLENVASQVFDRSNAYFSSGDWAAMSEVMAQNMIDDDRRRTVNAGIRRGRDAEIANCQAVAETGTDSMTSAVLAIRGEHLVLCRTSLFGRDDQPGAYHIEMLSVVEIDADGQLATHVAFDPDDLDAAFAELDARYVVGEAAANARTWSLIAESYAAIRRHELPPITPDCVTIDHRRAVSFAPGDLIAYIRSGRELGEEFQPRIEVVHRLTNRGAVITYAAHGTSSEGFEAEWREVSLSMVDGDLINRCELFGDADVAAAIARFDALSQPARRLENAASQVYERLWTYFKADDWRAVAELFAGNIANDDRRRVVNAGIEHGRDVQVANLRRLADIGANIVSSVLATRGERLILNRIRTSNSDLRLGEFDSEMLNVIETDFNDRIVAGVAIRRRRARRCYRRARRPIPRRRSRRPLAHLVSHHGCLHGAQSA